jgi:hypothetical protein
MTTLPENNTLVHVLPLDGRSPQGRMKEKKPPFPPKTPKHKPKLEFSDHSKVNMLPLQPLLHFDHSPQNSDGDAVRTLSRLGAQQPSQRYPIDLERWSVIDILSLFN